MNNLYVYLYILIVIINKATIQNQYIPCVNNSVIEMRYRIKTNHVNKCIPIKIFQKFFWDDGRYSPFQVMYTSYTITGILIMFMKFFKKDVSNRYWDNILLNIVFKFELSVYLSQFSAWPATPTHLITDTGQLYKIIQWGQDHDK